MRGRPTPVYALEFDVDAPSANVAASSAQSATAGITHVIHWIAWSYGSTGTLAGGKLTVLNTTQSAILFEIDISSKKEGFHHFRDQPVYGGEGDAIDVILAAGGVNILGKLSVCYS